MSRVKQLALVAVVLLAASPVPADDLSGSSVFLCSPSHASLCSPDGECAGGPSWNYKVPQFIVVDLDAKTLGTTEASGENRTTPVKNLQRDGDLIILQGYEQGRAFSIVITESTGKASIGVALGDAGVVVFGVCTPKT